MNKAPSPSTAIGAIGCESDKRNSTASRPLGRRELFEAFGHAKVLFLIPAAPGFYVLTPCYIKTDALGLPRDALREPVVAWALTEIRTTTPVTPHGVLADYEEPAILYPDGGVRSHDRRWESVTTWLKEQKAMVQHGKLR